MLTNIRLTAKRQTLFASAAMTIPRLVREVLMAVISLNLSPWDWLFCTRSLPARSTKHREAGCRQNGAVESGTQCQWSGTSGAVM
ncbi:hypothetical protein JZ751_010700 [Albula glossodonta]|uniref:Uncharacterized protein n=1 Tax=Albula glossodonta TaxID=121402 RepID=A0A8T2N2P3_9TELE|nr:hypothetical protein JZ751_010700 [Albula glossodonta]